MDMEVDVQIHEACEPASLIYPVSSKLVKDDLNKTKQTKVHGQQLKMMIYHKLSSGISPAYT